VANLAHGPWKMATMLRDGEARGAAVWGGGGTDWSSGGHPWI
jgi:hypothetical protein